LVNSSEKRIPEFDGLRGIAIALVLWWHLVEPNLQLGAASWQGWLRALTNLTWSGVDLFFVLSGYFIGGILIDRRESPRLGRVFYLRRAARILPLYWLMLLVCLVAGHFGWIAREHPGWVYWLFLSNIAIGLSNGWDAAPLSVTWSLAVEEQFYLAAPWVIRAVAPARLPWLLGGVIAGAVLLRLGMWYLFPGAWTAMHTLTPLRMDLLAMGVLIAWAVRAEVARPFFARLGQHWLAWLAAGCGLFLALTINRPGLGSPLMAGLGYSVLTAFYGLLVAIVAGVRPPALCRVLSCAPLVSLGRYSYFIYLWHFLIGAGVFHLLHGPSFPLGSTGILLASLAGIAATWAAGAVSWRWFESPLLALGRRLQY